MAKHDEMTRHAFISHMQAYMKKLLTDPLHADTDEFLKGHNIDGPRAMKILTMRSNPEDENSAIVIKKASIKDNGYDKDGKRLKDTFSVKYTIPRKDYTKKMRNLYISLFESNIIPECPIIEEGAWGYGPLDNDEALDYQSESAKEYLSKVVKDVESSDSSDTKWARVGVLLDFLKKYKNDELQVTKEYNNAIDVGRAAVNALSKDQAFISSWSDKDKIKASLKKAIEDMAALRYNENIMNSDNMPKEKMNVTGFHPNFGPETLMEDGEGGGATSADASGQYTTPLFGGPIRRKTVYITQEQVDFIKDAINEEEGGMAGMGGATTTQTTGDYQYTVPFGAGKKKKGDDFYKEANDHQDMMKKSWAGTMEEEKSSIHIKEKNKGKFNATKARTGKSTEELTHSKNPVTKKRAIFAQNVAKWNKK